MNNTKIVFRKALPSDTEQCVYLINKVWESAYKNIFPAEIFKERRISAKDKIDKMVEYCKNKSKHELRLVVYDKDKLIATSYGTTISNYQHYFELGYADLVALYILPEYQHCEIGKKLFEKTKNHFQKQKIDKMVIGVLKDNYQARKAYEKWGGVLDSFEQPFEKNGKNYPEVFYIFDL